MATSNYYVNLASRHQVYLERLKAGYIRDYQSTTQKLDGAIKDILNALEVGTLDELTQKDLRALLKDLREVSLSTYQSHTESLLADLQELSDEEINFETEALKKATVGVTVGVAASAWSATLNSPIQATGELLEPFIKDLSSREVARIEKEIRTSVAQGRTISQTVRAVRGTKENNYRDGVLGRNWSDARTVIRTATQHVSSQARVATWRANSDIIEGYQWVSTLDGKTSQRCRSLDGQVFGLGGTHPKSEPPPPPPPEFSRESYEKAGDSFKRLVGGDYNKLMNFNHLDFGLEAWPNFSEMSAKDLKMFMSNAEMVVINGAPGGKPQRYKTSLSKVSAKYGVTPTPGGVRPNPKPKEVIKASTPTTAFVDVPARDSVPPVEDYNLRVDHDPDLSSSDKRRLDKLIQRGVELFPNKYRHLVTSIPIETSSRKLKSAAFSFNDKYVVVNAGVVDADYITHELFHGLDDRFSVNFVSSSLKWNSGDPTLDTLALNARREFISRKKRGLSQGRVVGNQTLNYHNGNWDDWYEAVQYGNEGVSPEYLTVSAQRYLNADEKTLNRMREIQPDMLRLLEYMYEND